MVKKGIDTYLAHVCRLLWRIETLEKKVYTDERIFSNPRCD